MSWARRSCACRHGQVQILVTLTIPRQAVAVHGAPVLGNPRVHIVSQRSSPNPLDPCRSDRRQRDCLNGAQLPELLS